MLNYNTHSIIHYVIRNSWPPNADVATPLDTPNCCSQKRPCLVYHPVLLVCCRRMNVGDCYQQMTTLLRCRVSWQVTVVFFGACQLDKLHRSTCNWLVSLLIGLHVFYISLVLLHLLLWELSSSVWGSFYDDDCRRRLTGVKWATQSG